MTRWEDKRRDGVGWVVARRAVLGKRSSGGGLRLLTMRPLGNRILRPQEAIDGMMWVREEGPGTAVCLHEFRRRVGHKHIGRSCCLVK